MFDSAIILFRKYRWDFVVIIVLIFISLIFSIYNYEKNSSHDGDAHVVISVNGEIYNKFPINEDDTFLISTEYGNNLIEILNGNVTIKDADCPDKICMNEGPVGINGGSIICLPNRLEITIKFDLDNTDNDIDAYAY